MSATRELRVLHLCADVVGGAGKATLRLHRALAANGIDSRVLARQVGRSSERFVSQPTGFVNSFFSSSMKHIDKLPNKFYQRKLTCAWSNNLTPTWISHDIDLFGADIVHMHWVGAGFIPVWAFRPIHQPIVWTLHDMWAFTGGCHYSGRCLQYLEKCGRCPELGSKVQHDLSRTVWSAKDFAFRGKQIDVVCPSTWIAACSRKSSLLAGRPVHVIANGIDLATFTPVDKGKAREKLNLPRGKFFIAFGAASLDDQRKGYSALIAALKLIREAAAPDSVELLTFGTKRSSSELSEIPTRHFGTVEDESKLALLYSSADVFCAPSKQENLATTALESLACGTPVVAFNVGGFSDIITHLSCGFLAEPFSPTSLAEGLRHFYFQTEASASGTRDAARRKAETCFDSTIMAKSYSALYSRLIARNSTGHSGRVANNGWETSKQ